MKSTAEQITYMAMASQMPASKRVRGALLAAPENYHSKAKNWELELAK